MHPDSAYDFGVFRLLPMQRKLVADGQEAKLGSRAFDLLLVLVQHSDRLLFKHELLDLVWPGEDVEEANLAVQVMALRKVLGRSAIATLPGRGYRFTLPVVESASALATPVRPRTNLPERTEPLLGRAQEEQALQTLLAAHEHVTLVGTGGVGKTRLALQVARRLAMQVGPGQRHHLPEGVWWVELAALSEPGLVAAAVARVLRTGANDERDATQAVAAALRAGPALLVLDNAEHVLDGVAPLVSLLRQRAPQARLLVTSQEPLRTPGEHLMRLAPLSLPAQDSLAGARLSGAVALFEARAQAQDTGFSLNADTRAAVVDICRQLDGIPLAIELAVARLPLLGLAGLRHALRERLQVLTVHTRASLPRHQTLRAALDWSHSLLRPVEQRALRRLAVFCGGFTLQAAQQVAQDGVHDEAQGVAPGAAEPVPPDACIGAWEVLQILGALVDKSLVVAELPAAPAGPGPATPAAEPRYRLLESTRLHALQHLQAAGEQALTQERHARALDAMLTVARPDARLWRTPPASPAALLAELDNARAALEWAGHCDDDALAVSLAAGCSHVFLAAALNAEYLQRVLPLRHRVQGSIAPRVAGLFWARIALASSRNAHPAGLDAGQRAAAIYRDSGDAERLYDALTWTIAIGSRHGLVQPLQALVDEAQALEQPAWPAAARSSFQWAQYRWLQMQGRPQEALRCARAQAELFAQDGHWATHVAWGANVADCELALGRLPQAEALARAALDALQALAVDENIVGHVWDMLMIALTLQGRSQEALDTGRRARRLLEREGDELRLLDTLALNALTTDRWAAAARVAGHADAAIALRGEFRWPAVAARRIRLQRGLEAAMSRSDLQRELATGARLSRDEALALALAD